MYQLLDVYQLSTEDIVTHVCLLEEGPKINVCLSIKQDKMYLLMLAESCQDDSNRIIFRTSVRILDASHFVMSFESIGMGLKPLG